MSKSRNPRYQITLPEKYSRILDLYCEKSGEAPASFSAIAVRKELDRLQQSGEIDLHETLSDALDENKLLKDFILAVVECDEKFDVNEISERIKVDPSKLKGLLKRKNF